MNNLPAEHEALFAPARILYLSEDPALIAAQLRGERITLAQAGALRNDVSTDEITPVHIMSHYDDKLARFPYTGLRCGGVDPIAPEAVARGGFGITVAGKRYGKGSSREHSPAAERLAGIRLVFAESFERLYRQNADNIGLITCTDFSLLEQLEHGQAVPLAALLQGRDALAQAILREGGLLRFGQRHLRTVHRVSTQTSTAPGTAPGPRTLFRKIIERKLLHTGITPAAPAAGDGVFVQADWRFIHEYYTGMAAHLLATTFNDAVEMRDPQSIVVFEDHSAYVEESPAHLRHGLVANMHAMMRAQRDFVARHRLREYRTLTEAESLRDDGRHVAGISHAMMAEHHALPGQLVVGTDSHTTHSGALGCAAYGVGTTDMANAFVTGAVRLTLPREIRIVLEGRLPEGVTAKDVVLHLLSMPDMRRGDHIGCVFEFCGPVIEGMDIDERATLTNMTAELGGLTGIVAPDARTVAFLRERRGIDFIIEDWMRSDDGAACAHEVRVDCSTLGPMLAAPGDPGRGIAVEQLDAPVRIDMAYGGSCTAGKREDFVHYHAVLAWGLSHGLRVPPHVKLFLQYGTTAVRDWCVAQGFDATFEAAGARMLQPSCGACANCGPGSSSEATQVTISAINRNFPGRSGPGQVWLASPPTVMASALAGEVMSFDQLKARVAAGWRPANA
ncbi:MAG: 3-isopropylmalate dehydratase [Betaproteobacteria bacterium]|nr:3-isopropylmalate dehydratase [Betaproteobacteria bacterium]